MKTAPEGAVYGAVQRTYFLAVSFGASAEGLTGSAAGFASGAGAAAGAGAASFALAS